jgi:chromate reductase, NAD(P)H dehydrogenase (quinone)
MNLDVVVLCGSLRTGSLNRALAEATIGTARPPLRLDLWSPSDVLPRLDIAPGDPMPMAVDRLRARVADANAVLFATPEFNRSVPGYVKDLVDWLGVRTPPRPLVGKVCALMSASPDRHGGAFAQLALAELLRRAGADVVTDLEVAIGYANREALADGSSTPAIERLLARLEAELSSHRSSVSEGLLPHVPDGDHVGPKPTDRVVRRRSPRVAIGVPDGRRR